MYTKRAFWKNQRLLRTSEISFAELTIEEMDSYAAVFIMYESLTPRSESQYADIYLDSDIPLSVGKVVYSENWGWTAD
ncbi:hypothetical protein [Bacillus sp. 2205SS5-2]|uniref:hypothetical protein n=1 Tax=Bacillus sp. 2205SS5-2 TaxID=3109031 RepID=UPI003004CBC9